MRRIALPFVVGLVASCFRPPAPAVLFSCDPDSAPACPDGYSCEADGCCHEDGSDVGEHEGECRLAPDTEGSTTVLTATEDSASSGTTDTTGTATGTATGTTGTESGTTATSEGTSTTDATSTSDAASSSDGISSSG